MARLLLLALLLYALPANAGEPHIIELHNRPADEMVPLLEPMLNDGESISGRGFRLILNADPARQTQLRALIEQLDTAPAQLMVTVFQGSERELRSLRLEGGARYENDGVRVDIDAAATGSAGIQGESASGHLRAGGRVIGTRTHRDDAPLHRLRVSAGSVGYIETGTSVPYFSGQVYSGDGRHIVESGVQYRDVVSGFYVRPRLSGQRVLLEIAPQRETLDDSRAGAVDTRRAATTLNGRLGEWIELGGGSRRERRTETGAGRHYATRDRHSQSIWIRVDRIE